MKQLRLHSAAGLETAIVSIVYEKQRNGLGAEFKKELNEAFAQIGTAPLQRSIVHEGCRCYRLSRFPFGVIYREHAHFIEVLAVMHLQRQPGYWTDRL